MGTGLGAPVDALTGLSASRAGLYIHFPFCLAKCPYCDFAVTVDRRIPHERYARAVQTELRLWLAADPSLRERLWGSVFIGGGTPSLWEPVELGRVLETIRTELSLSADVEVSLEANPEVGLSQLRLSAFREAGVNRLSLGAQSFETETLKRLGRAHQGSNVVAAVHEARRAGFENLSVDLIYGVPGQSVAQATADAERAVGLGLEHVSLYALTVESEALAEETPFARQYRRGTLGLPPDDAIVDMADAAHGVLERAGLARYEISNFARPGFHSRHNALYWTGGEYAALGVGATRTLRSNANHALRSVNLRSTPKYLERVEAGELPVDSREVLGPLECFEERLSLGLRLSTGVDVRTLATLHGQTWAGAREREASQMVEHGLATWREDRLVLTARGAHLHSAVCARLL